MSRARRSGRALVLASLVLVTACGAAEKPEARSAPLDEREDAAPLTPDSSPIGLRRSMVADEYFWLRAKALEGDVPEPFREALGAMQDLRAALSADPAAWEDLEVPLGTVRRASELSSAYALLPVKKDVAKKEVPLRSLALRLARALEATEIAYRNGPFREHDAEISRAAKDLSTRLLPNVEPIVRALESEMTLPGASRPIVVTLVGDAPYPGIFAADARGRTTASFVRVHALDGGALAETLLHEVLHAIDELTVRMPTAMNALRHAMERGGLDASDPSLEMAINTVTFAEAASLVRRFVDPKHRPLGERGFYTLYAPAPAIVEAWNRRVEGGSIDEATEAIVQAVTAP